MDFDWKHECADNLCGHLRVMVRKLRKIPADRWDWTPDAAAPTARILAAHAWQWLICDRQHIEEPDVTKHALIPEPPADPDGMCDALSAEIDRWEEMLKGLSPEKLVEPRNQFQWGPLNVGWFVMHMLQNCIYKHGQLSTLFFALRLDGDAPYDAPFPNRCYDEFRRIQSHDGCEQNA